MYVCATGTPGTIVVTGAMPSPKSRMNDSGCPSASEAAIVADVANGAVPDVAPMLNSMDGGVFGTAAETMTTNESVAVLPAASVTMAAAVQTPPG